jgi:uncharacterized protein involved in response to NO
MVCCGGRARLDGGCHWNHDAGRDDAGKSWTHRPAAHGWQGRAADYAAVIVSALARIAAAFGIADEPLLELAAGAWILAFCAFAALFGPLLIRPRGERA